ncbi:molybdopterin cofactor-binding domain-containing protein [Nocardioides acrostichi]|uniref:Xanthine dehydrogenase family protein molybdopterin-binding subunit n=1 Tax=Nocardioides acrostichi TaxID=2784339 RepID=A0A930UXF2_9ACTN|nr:molybdopterin cofactor-binding domain-containing protein [Nocardioides acrostichi]MBF4162643.1 xanthine dehydrogenase family protein molybdopterin-binding subunit [Nocardioides acrostichi]
MSVQAQAVDPTPAAGLSRRSFVGWVLGGATLVTAADLTLGRGVARASVPSGPQVPELYDLEDLQTDAALPTSQLITVTMNDDGTASFELPRMEVGQGITTSTAMIIAEELDIDPGQVKVGLAPARPELIFNQLTGGSNTTVSTYTPIRVAAAIAKGALLDAAAAELGYAADQLTTRAGVVSAPDGSSLTYGELASKAASPRTKQVDVELKKAGDFSVIGTARNRDDALLAVTGRKKFIQDLHVKGALPTMVCRPPTLNGSPKKLRNKKKILRMPGVKNVAIVDTGVAVRAKTFGQCIDAIRAMDVVWNPGSVEGESDRTIMARLKKAELPLAVPDVPVLADQVDTDFEFMFRSSAALEPNGAIADVRDDRATIWAGLKVPILAQENIAKELGMSIDQVTVNVITGGGSFGHKLFSDHAIEAAKISKKMGKPVKLMWHRADEPRQGRLHPMATSRIRATMLAGEVLTFEQRNTSVVTDFSHGLGEIITSTIDEAPTEVGRTLGGLGFSETIFTLTQELPYDFGVVTQLLNETDDRFNTGSMRNIYSPDTAVAAELTIDQMAAKMGKDPLEFRLAFLKDDRTKAVLEKVAKEGNWGRTMPKGMAQGIAIHKEYKGSTACLVEIDCRPRTVDRDIYHAVTGPRVTKAVFAVDAGLVINPRGLEAQMMGGFSDGLALTLTSSCHLRNGHFLEASWDNYFYTRQWNIPPEFECHIVDSGTDQPGGAGEAGVPSSAAAVACAYARATGTMPKRFPINHDELSFKPKSFVPPVPQSPRDGLKYTY